MNLYEPNNKLVSVYFEHFGARTNHVQTRTHKTKHGPNLGEATTFPLIIYFVPTHKTSTTLGGHNFMCRLSIEMKSEVKL
jgi:hypothetical protein